MSVPARAVVVTGVALIVDDDCAALPLGESRSCARVSQEAYGCCMVATVSIKSFKTGCCKLCDEAMAVATLGNL